ncbi:MAG: histidinol-phosphate transaminase [Verrucomicrobia bacterium]|nr:histidinol-phosphate transaminase [Verrucomicrobiota bacterium]
MRPSSRSVPSAGFTRREWLKLGGASLAGLALAGRGASVASAATPPAPAAAGAGGVLRLNLNENLFGPSPRAIEAISRELGGLARYTGDEAEAFIQAVAVYEKVPAEHIVLGNMLEPLGLQLGLRGGPGGEFPYSTPGYNALVEAARPVGGLPVDVPLRADLRDDLAALRAAVGPRTRALFLVHPHNPTGLVHDLAEFKTFVREVSKQVPVIVDEAYLEFADDYDARTATDLIRAGENVIVYRTFSKAHGLAALPLGYAIAPRGLAAELRKAGIGAPRSLNRLALAAATASLADRDFIPGVKARVAAERDAWHAFIDGLGRRRTESKGNFVFFETGRPQKAFAAALAAQGVEIARGFPPLDTWARISIGLPEENARAREAVRRVLA